VRAAIASVWGAAAALVCASALAQSAATEDRLVVSADGSTLSGTGGGGGSLGWLHNFDASTLVGVAVEHQVLADSNWTFGSVNGSLAMGPDNQRYGIYGEAHEGAGDDASHAFHYRIEAVGVTGTFAHKLTAVLEDRRVDVETTHGNLPKAGLSYLWGPHVLTSLSYQDSVSGNLGTRITSLRIDSYWARVNVFAGAAFGQASPAIFNIETNILNGQSRILAPARDIHEEYLGATKPFPRWHGELTLVADYIDLSGLDRATLTLTYVYHLGR